MRRERGLTVIEVLIALVVIAVAFAALAYAQLTSLKASSRSRLTSEAKTVAENVLENRLSQVLKVDSASSVPSGDSQYNDASTGYKSFYFVDYYWTCGSGGAESVKNPTGSRSALRSNISCSGSTSRSVQDGTVDATWSISGEAGPLGEGVIDITVTATHSGGPSVTLSDRLSCYDVYPSPTIDKPAPCPVPEQSGGGRSS